MKLTTRKSVTARLRTISGHLRAVERMVDEDTLCREVLRQTMAIEKALQRVEVLIIEGHLGSCVAAAFRQGTAEKTIKELSEIFRTSRK